MNFRALDIIHTWTDSRGETIQKIFPTNGKVCVCCTSDLSMEAAKVCHFINLIEKQPWTFQTSNEHEIFLITFSPEAVSLQALFDVETRRSASKTKGTKKPPRKRETAGDDSNQLNLKCNL